MDALDFDLMAKETFDLTKELTDAQRSFWSVDEEFFETEVVPTQKVIPHSPGLIFKLDKGVSTFSVRGFATDNLFYSMEDVLNQDDVLVKKLRLQDVDELSSVMFFETTSIEMAEVIEDQLIGRRFPNQEDVLCNLSDPGFSWWMDHGDNFFHIFFTSHGIHREDEYTKLGPMGDGLIAAKRLRQAESWLRSLFSINEFSVSDKAFGLSATDASQKMFSAVKQLFLSGETVLMEEDFPSGPHGRTLGCYFNELATIRRFWLIIEELLEE